MEKTEEYDSSVYDMNDPMTAKAIQNLVDPNQRIKDVEVVFENSKVNKYVLDYISSDLKKS